MELSHIDKNGNAKMVNVQEKDVTRRVAVAEGKIYMQPQTVVAISSGDMKKGNVINTAKVAAIMAGKRTADIIPMCHNVPLNGLDVDLITEEDGVKIVATAYTDGKTGVEMEALTAVSVAALTVYDMAKAIDRAMVISDIRLMKKSGGKSGEFIRSEENENR